MAFTPSAPARLGAALAGMLLTTALTAPSASLAQEAGQPVNLTIASFAQGSSWYVYAVNLAELLRTTLPEGSSFDTPPIAGGVGNPQLVAAGKADLAFGMAVVGNWALEGKFAFEQAYPDLRALVGGWDQYYLVPLGRGGEVPAEMDAYFEANPTAEVVLLRKGSVGAFGGQQLLELAGAGEDALSDAGGSYEFGSFDMVKTRFANGTGDVFVQVATKGHPSITEMAETMDVTFLQPSQEVLDEMRERYGWEEAALPQGTFPDQDAEVTLPGTTTALFTSTAMTDDLAYTIVKSICEGTQTLQAAHKALAGFDCANGAWKPGVNGLPLHPGAERYYRERGWLD